MILPVVNKKKAKTHIIRISIFVALLYIAFYFLTKSLTLLFYFSVFNLFITILLLRNHRKNNFEASFIDNQLIIEHRKKKTKIPLTEIWDVKNEINNYLGSDGKLAVVYTLYLKKVYPFGDEIHLSYVVLSVKL